jgi:hypothetical protein
MIVQSDPEDDPDMKVEVVSLSVVILVKQGKERSSVGFFELVPG